MITIAPRPRRPRGYTLKRAYPAYPVYQSLMANAAGMLVVLGVMLPGLTGTAAHSNLILPKSRNAIDS